MGQIKKHRPRRSHDGHCFHIDLYDKQKITCTKCGLVGEIYMESVNGNQDECRAEIMWSMKIKGRRPSCSEFIMYQALR